MRDHASATRPTLAIASGRRARASKEIGAFCERHGVRYLVPARRLPPGLDRGGLRWRLERRPRRPASELGHVPTRFTSSRRPKRLPSAAPRPLPWRRLLSRLGDRAAGAARLRPARTAACARRRDLEGSPVRGPRGPGGGEARTPGGGVRRLRRARDGRGCDAPLAPAGGSRSPPLTSPSPSRSPTCSSRSAGPEASASPTAAPCSTISAPPPTAASFRLGRGTDRLRGPTRTAAPRSTREVIDQVIAEDLHATFPELEGQADHAHVGRPDRRISPGPAAPRADPGRGQGRRRLQLRRQRRRAEPPGRAHARLDQPRSPRRVLAPGALMKSRKRAYRPSRSPLGRGGRDPTRRS